MASTPPAAAPRRRSFIASERGQGAVGIGVSILASLLGLVVLAWAILFVTKGRFLKGTFERIASSSSERTVTVGGDFQFYFAPFRLKFLADDLTVTNPEWAPRPNFWTSRHLEAWIAPFSLVFGDQYKFHRVELLDAAVDLEWDGQARRNTWTFGDPNAKGEPFQLPIIRQAQIAGTRIRYNDPAMQLAADIRVNTVQAVNTAVQGNITFAGDGRARGVPFTLTGGISTPNEAVTGGRLGFELHADSASNKLDVSGTLPGVTQIEGADLRVGVRGRNLARLFDLIGIAVPDTRAYRLTSNLTKAGDEWRFTKLAGGFGDSDIDGRMTLTLAEPGVRERMKVDADLASRKLDIIDIGPFIGFEPNALANQGATAAVAQTGGAVRIIPDAPLRIDMLKNFDAHVNYKVTTIRAPNLPVSNIALTLDLDNVLLKLSPLTMDVAGGHLASDISINARGRPVETAYDIRLSPTPMGRLLAGFGVAESGTTGTLKARVQMTGEGDTLRESLASSDGRIAVILPKGEFWTQYIQLSEFDVGTFVQKMFEDKLKEPVQINCGLIAFTVRDGIAAADPILIDTQKNVMLGRGGFSFKDESMDLAFRADAKKFSLFSGQSPVGIGGQFAAPSINVISPELLARAGAGIGLAVVAAPVAAVLAFVDVGDAKAASCGPVLSGARATAQRTAKGKPRDDVGKGRKDKDED